MDSKERHYIIIGAGGHAKVIADIALANLAQSISFWDDYKSGDHCSFPIITKEQLDLENSKHFYILGMGDLNIRKKVLAELEDMAINLATLIHPSSTISSSASLGDGTVVMPRAVLNADCCIGRHTVLNTSCVVEHDCWIGDNVQIAPGAVLGGGVKIGEHALIGLGAKILPGTTIGSDVIVGAGAVVVKDIPSGSVVVGNPARKLRSHT